MKQLLIFAVLVGCSLRCGAADTAGKADAATRAATQLVACMKAFDPACTASLTYSRYMEERGVPRESVVKSLTEIDSKLTTLGARYSRFELVAPTTVLAGDGEDYAFVPYVQVLEVGDRRGGLRAFFIGVSIDGGASWQFVDGANVTPATLRVIMPGYTGQELPPVTPLQPPP
jgi:hypothetical protein